MARDLARWCDEHVAALATHGRHYGLRLPSTSRQPTISRAVQRKLSDLLRRRPEPGLLLGRPAPGAPRGSGRVPGLGTAGLSAQAAKGSELIALTTQCHPQTLRQMRWAKTMLKELSPQALTS